MQWHYGNIGSALQGVAVIAIAVGALIKGPAALRAWIDQRHAESEEARERAETVRLRGRRRSTAGPGMASTASA